MFAINAESPYKTLADLIKAARAQPGKLNIGTIAVGSTQHLGAELFRSSAKLDIQLIPYKTTPDVIVGLLRNDIQVMIDFYAAMRAGLSDEKMRPLATSGTARARRSCRTCRRSPRPACPATRCCPGTASARRPARRSPSSIRLNKAIREVLAMPDVIKRYSEVGIAAQRQLAGGAAQAAGRRHQEVVRR